MYVGSCSRYRALEATKAFIIACELQARGETNPYACPNNISISSINKSGLLFLEIVFASMNLN